MGSPRCSAVSLRGYSRRVSAYERLLEFARTHPSVVGLVLSGSRGRNMGRMSSDWDCYVIIATGSVVDAYLSKLADGSLDMGVMTLDEFRQYAAPGTAAAWDAYAFAHVRVDHDGLDGEITRIAAGKEFLPEQIARNIAATSLDAYINATIRSSKSRRDGLIQAAALDAAEAVAPALETLFALDGRVRPYNRYLGWEIERHPPEAWATPSEMEALVAAAAAGHPPAGQSLFAMIESAARGGGLGSVVDAWEEEALALVRNR